MSLLDKPARSALAPPQTSSPKSVRRWTLSWTVSAAALSIGCGGAAVPNHQLTTAESSVRAAEVGGAEELPKGELHLKYARDAIAEARTLMDKGDNKQATLLLNKAAVDAEQALALAEEEEARSLAQEQLERIEELMKQ